ncbi:head-tail adaptor protein [Salipiger abyssi]|uniref:phage head completion protein n=1 Tax=Salipiger abyssi TaxID=1250539 RepID=UPI0009781590|nr:head-tail adaptor protein [Salipiger abyssi]
MQITRAKKRPAARLRERVTFDYPTKSSDGTGGVEIGWSDEPESITRAAEFIYSRGSEAVEAARLTGRSIYKIKVRSDSQTRAINATYRMRDRRRAGDPYNIREVDAITDRAWVYIVVEGGVAV